MKKWYLISAVLAIMPLLMSCVPTSPLPELSPTPPPESTPTPPVPDEQQLTETHHSGDLILSGNETYIIENQRFFIDGSIIVEDSASLILKNANLIVKNLFPWEYGILVRDKATFVAENSVLESPAQMNLVAEKGGTLILSNFTSIGDIGITVDGANVFIENSKRPFAQLFWKLTGPEGYPSQFHAVNSTLGRVDLTLGGLDLRRSEAEDIEIRGLKPGKIEKIQFKTSEGAMFNLEDSSVEYWVIEFSSCSKKRLTVKDSHLDSIWFCFLPDNSDIGIKDLKPTLYSDRIIQQGSQGGYLRLINTRVDWYKLLLYGVNAVIEDAESVQVAPWGNAHVVVKDSIVDWGVRLRGNETVKFVNTLIKERGIWLLVGQVHDPTHGGDSHIIEFSSSTIDTEITIACQYGEIKGDVSILTPIDDVNFQSGTILREYPVIIKDENGNPLPNVSIELIDPEGRSVWSGMTDKGGKALLTIEFTKENYTDEWQLEARVDNIGISRKLGFLTSTPITIEA